MSSHGDEGLSERWYRTLFESANDAMLVLDSRWVVECNSAAVLLFGLPRGVLLGKRIEDFSLPSGGQNEALAGLLQEARGGRPQRFDWEFNRADGGAVFAEVTLRRVEGAGPDVLVAVVRDVTERRTFEVALARSERRFRAVFQQAPVGAAMVDDQGRCVDMNAAFGDIFGPDDRRGSRPSIPPGGVPFSDITGLAFERGEVRDQDVVAQTPRGPRMLSLSSTRIELDEGTHWLTTFTDVTAFRSAQRELVQLNEQLEARVVERTAALERAMTHLARSEKLASLGSVVAGVAHELNTPLGNAVTVGSALATRANAFSRRAAEGSLLRSELSGFIEGVIEAAVLLEKNLSRAHALITSFKQVAIDQTSMRRRRFDLRDTVQEVLATLAHLLRASGCQTLAMIPAGITLDGYPGPLQQVLTNLIDNSLKHAFEGRDGGAIQIRANAEVDADAVRIVFEDDGCGMPPAVARRVFEPFFTTRLGHGGSGLGLYLAYNLVTVVMGGTIELVEHVRGARFELVLPLQAPELDGSRGMSEFPPIG